LNMPRNPSKKAALAEKAEKAPIEKPEGEKAEKAENARPKREKKPVVAAVAEAKPKKVKIKAPASPKAKSPKAKSPAKKAVKKVAKKAADGKHKNKPSYGKLVARLQYESKSRTGVTVQALAKYLKEHYQVKDGFERHLRQALRKLATDGYLVATSPARFRLSPKGKTKFGKGKKSKRPLSAYMQFVQQKRADIVKENPDAGFGEVGKLLGAAWKKLSAAEKAAFKTKKAKKPKEPKADGEKVEKAKKARARSESPKPKKAAKDSPKKKPAKKAEKAEKAEKADEAEKPKRGRKNDAAPKKRAAPARGAPERGADAERGAPERGEEQEPEVPEGPELGKGIWQYQDGGWRPYDAAANKILEEAYQDYLGNPHNFSVRAVKSGDWEYSVDFKNLTQTNVQHQAHTSRKIRRT